MTPIPVTTLSGLTFGLMFGLLRVDTPLTIFEQSLEKGSNVARP